MNNTELKWWQKAVIYQIYPRSFQDSDADGVGDIQGIIQRLDYLELLGIDAIWLSPVYQSPQADNGYDISDYQDIDPVFGTLGDMEQLIDEAKKRNIRIIMDLVLNHTSDKHRWFQEAKKSRENPYHDYYVWRDGVKNVPPNDMCSAFGGSAWEWVPQLEQYYFHQFAVQQPDLNWDNPKVRRELYDMILWWMDKGVEGFRLDVIDQVAKEPDKKITINGPKLHEYLRELSRETFRKGEFITVGEAWGANTDNARLYSNPDGSEFSMAFQFEHIGLDQQEGKEKWDLAPLSLPRLKEVMNRWQTSLYGCGWNSLFWDNHDLPRIVSRWGNDGKYRVQSAKMLAMLLHGMQGTPYIYQGEELGMTNADYGIGEYHDIETLNMYEDRLRQGYRKDDVMHSIHAKSRDNARTPMQWDASVNAGFTRGTPWMKINPNYIEINAADQTADENSVFSCYRQLISFRREYSVFAEGKFRLLAEEDESFFAYKRISGEEELLVICSFCEEEIFCPVQDEAQGMELLLGNYPDAEGREVYRPYEARMYWRKK